MDEHAPAVGADQPLDRHAAAVGPQLVAALPVAHAIDRPLRSNCGPPSPRPSSGPSGSRKDTLGWSTLSVSF